MDQIAELGIELAARVSSQRRALANARVATTALSRARVERDAVELFLDEHKANHLAAEVDDVAVRQQEPRASGS